MRKQSISTCSNDETVGLEERLRFVQQVFMQKTHFRLVTIHMTTLMLKIEIKSTFICFE